MNHHFGASFSVSMLSSMILCLLMLLRTPSREVVFFRALPFSPPPPSLRCWGVLKLSLEENSSSKSKAMSFSSSWAVSSSSAPLSASSGGVGGLLPGHFQSSSSHPGPAKFNVIHIFPMLKLLIHSYVIDLYIWVMSKAKVLKNSDRRTHITLNENCTKTIKLANLKSNLPYITTITFFHFSVKFENCCWIRGPINWFAL